MPYLCCVASCRSNTKVALKHGESSTTTFEVPHTKKCLYERILSKTLPNTAHVCIKHFEECYLTRCEQKFNSKRKPRVTLQEHALPTLNLGATNINQKIKRLRPNPEKRRKRTSKKLDEREKQKRKQFKLDDALINLEDIKSDSVKLSNLIGKNFDDWLYFPTANKINFIIIKEGNGESNIPSVMQCVVIRHDLTVSAYYNSVELPRSKISDILGKTNICNTWTKLKNVLNKVLDINNTADNNTEEVKSELLKVIQQLEQLASKLGGREDEELLSLRLQFVKEQIKNYSMQAPKYSIDMMLFACNMYYSYPAAYRKLRDTGVLVLPHPSYLRRIEAQVVDFEPGLDESHKRYICQKCIALSARQRYVVLILDEIYCKAGISYVGGKLQGKAMNKESRTAATTVQAFMVKSLFSDYKDMVALFPVHNITAKELEQMIMKVMHSLSEAGFTVLAVVSDNNRVNRKAFDNICGGEMKDWIPHPFSPSHKFFFLFDAVHNFKNSRNNWINSVLANQSFLFRHPDDLMTLTSASFGHLRELYLYEKGDIIRLAPGLCYKAIFPTSMERQNMTLVVKIFNEENISALEEVKDKLPNCNPTDVDGTITFLKLMLTWWHIVNVKTPVKGIHQKNVYMEPIRSMDSEQIKFLRKFCSFLQEWDKFKIEFPQESTKKIHKKKRDRMGKFTEETHFALLHSTKTIINIVQYCLEDLNEEDEKIEYFLTGVLQSDYIERRFGRYRSMSGACYHVSVAQIMQSEKKLKVLSLLNDKKSESAKYSLLKLQEEAKISSTVEDITNMAVQFENAINDSLQFCVKDKTLKVVICVAGYAAKKCKLKLNCKTCFSMLSTPEELPANLLTYINRIDRGGMTRPSDLLFNLAMYCYKLFNTLISTKYESSFMEVKSQKELFIKLCENFFGLFDVEEQLCAECRCPVTRLLQMCLPRFANIFLNNFSKYLSENIKSKRKNKRKLKTLQDKADSNKIISEEPIDGEEVDIEEEYMEDSEDSEDNEDNEDMAFMLFDEDLNVVEQPLDLQELMNRETIENYDEDFETAPSYYLEREQ